MIGPGGQPPPQAARAFVRQLLSGRRVGRPELACARLDPAPGYHRLSFLNEGGQTAVATRCVVTTASGLAAITVGDVAPGVSVEAPLPSDVDGGKDTFKCAWWCRDTNGRAYAWSYDGRRKKLGRRAELSAEALLAAMYR